MGNFYWFWFYRWIDLEINILLWFFVVSVLNYFWINKGDVNKYGFG